MAIETREELTKATGLNFSKSLNIKCYSDDDDCYLNAILDNYNYTIETLTNTIMKIGILR